jgi:hypothetical protein
MRVEGLCRKGRVMGRMVLGVALASLVTLPAIGADNPTKATSSEHEGQRLACHWVGKDLRQLRVTHPRRVPAPQVTAANTPVSILPVEVARRAIERMAVVVGIAF